MQPVGTQFQLEDTHVLVGLMVPGNQASELLHLGVLSLILFF